MSDNEDNLVGEEEEEEEEEQTIADPSVLNKQKVAGEIANKALAAVVKECQVGKVVLDLCEMGDKIITEETAKSFSKGKGEKKVKKGVASPTCVSVNEIACYYTPLATETPIELKDGDVVRIDLAAHIDGHAATAAHTVIVQAEPAPLTGKLADALAAAQKCLDVAIHQLRPGATNNQVTDFWESIAKEHDVTLCDAVLSHQMKRWVLDDTATIISKKTPEEKVETVEFEAPQVWGVDIVISTGAGKLKEKDTRTTVFRRSPEAEYHLKLKAGQAVIKDIDERFPQFPFTLRSLDAKTGRLGITECLKHEMVLPYPVLHSKPDETIIQFKATLGITSTSLVKIAGLPFEQKLETDKVITDKEVKAALATSLKFTQKKKKKKAAKE